MTSLNSDWVQEQAPDDVAFRVARNAVTVTDVDKVSLDRARVVQVDPTTEVKLDTLKVTDQKQSGRCWMFASFNLFRGMVAEKLGLEDFEFSESYLQFFDLLEKANVFLQEMQRLKDRPFDDREVHTLLRSPIDDGGQFNYFADLVQKYGVVPRYAMPETQSSSRTTKMVRDANTCLRRGALAVRKGADPEAVLRDVYRILAVHLGVPPKEFAWHYRNKDKEYVRGGVMTPKQFAEEFLPRDLDQYVSIAHDPRPGIELHKHYEIAYEKSVAERPAFNYVTASLDELTELAVAALEDDTPVWFTCDVNRQFHSGLGIWDEHLYDYDSLYGVELDMTKEEQMLTQESVLTHAMVFTGLDNTPGRDRRWRVENSWGTKMHKEHDALSPDGFGTMTQSWFNDNVFSIVLHKDRLPEHLKAAVDEPAITLPVWDAMA